MNKNHSTCTPSSPALQVCKAGRYFLVAGILILLASCHAWKRPAKTEIKTQTQRLEQATSLHLDHLHQQNWTRDSQHLQIMLWSPGAFHIQPDSSLQGEGPFVLQLQSTTTQHHIQAQKQTQTHTQTQESQIKSTQKETQRVGTTSKWRWWLIAGLVIGVVWVIRRIRRWWGR